MEPTPAQCRACSTIVGGLIYKDCRLSRCPRGRQCSPEARARMSLGQLKRYDGKPIPAELRARMGAPQIGRPLSEAHRLAITETKRSNPDRYPRDPTGCYVPKETHE